MLVLSKKSLIKAAAWILVFFSFGSLAYGEDIRTSRFAGTGEAVFKDGKAQEAAFNQPYGLAIDADGGLLVADSWNNRIRRIKDGMVTTVAGTSEYTDSFGLPQGGYLDGDADKAYFNRPRDLVADSEGTIFVSDTGNNAIRKIARGKVYTFAGTAQAGYADGLGAEALFNGPAGIAVDEEDNLYIADSMNNVIRKITPSGVVSTFAGKASEKGGYKDGPAAEAAFNEPSGVAVDKDGVVYIVDSGNQLIRRVIHGHVYTVAGVYGEAIPGTDYIQGGFENGKGSLARFNFPKGIFAAANGIVFIADTWNNRIRAVNPDETVVTAAGSGIPGLDEGVPEEARFSAPSDIVYDNGRLYIADMWNNTLRSLPLALTGFKGVTDRYDLIKGIDLTSYIDDTGISNVPGIWIDKKKVRFPDSQPYIEDNRVKLPLRFVFEAWGAEVTWIGTTKQVEVRKGSFYRLFAPGFDEAYFRENRTYIDALDMAGLTGIRGEWYPEFNAFVMASEE